MYKILFRLQRVRAVRVISLLLPCNIYMYLYYYRWFFGFRNSHLVVAVQVLRRVILWKLLLPQVLRRYGPSLSRRCNLKNKQGGPRKKQSGRMIYTLLNLVTYVFREKKMIYAAKIDYFNQIANDINRYH